MKKSSNRKGLDVGKLGNLAMGDAYPGVGFDALGLCVWAIIQGAPEDVPRGIDALDQKFTLRELIEGAAIIGHEAQKILLDFAIEGRSFDAPLKPSSRKKNKEALDRINAVVKSFPDEMDGRSSPVRAAALLATLFSFDVCTDAGVAENWQDASQEVAEWQSRVRDGHSE